MAVWNIDNKRLNITNGFIVNGFCHLYQSYIDSVVECLQEKKFIFLEFAPGLKDTIADNMPGTLRDTVHYVIHDELNEMIIMDKCPVRVLAMAKYMAPFVIPIELNLTKVSKELVEQRISQMKLNDFVQFVKEDGNCYTCYIHGSDSVIIHDDLVNTIASRGRRIGVYGSVERLEQVKVFSIKQNKYHVRSSFENGVILSCLSKNVSGIINGIINEIGLAKYAPKILLPVNTNLLDQLEIPKSVLIFAAGAFLTVASSDPNEASSFIQSYLDNLVKETKSSSCCCDCGEPVVGPKHHVSIACKDVYCLVCKEKIYEVNVTKGIPIRCVVSGCKKAIVLDQDLFCCQQTQGFARVAWKHFKSRNENRLKPCPTQGCDAVYDVESVVDQWNCPECFTAWYVSRDAIVREYDCDDCSSHPSTDIEF